MFGKRLAELRNSRKISQYELANRLKFSRAQIANYEQGTREPDFQTLIILADFFDVSLDYLLGRTEQQIVADTPSVSDDISIIGDRKELLTNKEIEYLQASLTMFRQLEAKWNE